MTHERRRVGLRGRRKGVGEDRVKQRRREDGRGTERHVERQVLGGLRATVKAFPVGDMVLSRDGP